MEESYRDVDGYSDAEIEEAISRDEDPVKLSRMIIAVALYHHDVRWSVEKCLALASHRDPIVRGNAIIGFGHLARRFGELDACSVKPVIERGLVDRDQYVTGQAWAAASDAVHFLKWEVKGFDWGVIIDQQDME